MDHLIAGARTTNKSVGRTSVLFVPSLLSAIAMIILQPGLAISCFLVIFAAYTHAKTLDRASTTPIKPGPRKKVRLSVHVPLHAHTRFLPG